MALRRSHRVWVDMGPEWTRVRRTLSHESSAAPGKFHDVLRSALGPAIAKVRRQALAIPAHGAKHTGLRARLAAGVVGDVVGQTAHISATAVDPTEQGLPRGMDSGLAGWRHPVYGNRDVWVHQRGYSWFREPLSEEQDSIERKLSNVLEQMADNIADAGRGN
jgi:hypothetical protein